jgi:protein-S-isoprenylcysteine O-methyltransferase Ste14
LGQRGRRRTAAERDEELRAKLEPYAEGERPWPIKASVVVCVLIAIANPILYLAGWEVSGEDPNLGGALALCVVLLAAAYGMWRMRYWAVLGFEMLLGITLVYAGLSLLVPSNWEAVALAVGVMAIAGTLFWKLIRVMARIQLPERKRAAP